MTVSTTAARAEYTGNGSTTAFSVVDTGGASAIIPVLDATHIQVYVDGTLKTLNSDYTVSIVAATNAATVTFTTSPTDNTPASNTSIVILRVVPYTQLQDYVNNDAFDAENVETALDQLTQANQQIVDDKDRSFKFSSTIASSDFHSNAETASSLNSTKSQRANKALKFDANGDLSISVYDSDSFAVEASASADAAALSASQAETSANDAGVHKETASTKASEASTSEVNASNSATNASNSAVSAAASAATASATSVAMAIALGILFTPFLN